jgi:hypothetical protein
VEDLPLLDAAQFAPTNPSGIVLGVVRSGCIWRKFIGAEAPGLDRIFQHACRVLCANFLDLVVISSFSVVMLLKFYHHLSNREWRSFGTFPY